MPKFIDLTGQTINGIIVIEQAPKRCGKIMWKCQCFCGKIFEVESYSLRSGHTRSCGCLKDKIKKDETGKTYGLLTVLGPAESHKGEGATWLCECKCGKKIIVRGSALRGGQTSCGCQRIKSLVEYNKKNNVIDITGQRFGLLEAIEPTDQRNNNKVVWKCKCDCGNICYVSGTRLRNGDTKSCGCLKNSYGEFQISKILTDNNIKFEKEKTFQDLIFENSGYLARFDFFVNNSYVIEYDGKQHFIQGTGKYDNKDRFERTQEHDKIKNEYCKQHNIPLIRIPFTEINNLNIDMLKPETSIYLLKN